MLELNCMVAYKENCLFLSTGAIDSYHNICQCAVLNQYIVVIEKNRVYEHWPIK